MAAHPKPHPAKLSTLSTSASIKPVLVGKSASRKRHPTREPIAAAKAKTHFLQLLDQVEESGQPITITKRGRVVAQLIAAPAAPEISAFDQIYGRSKGWMTITGDIVSPDWESWGPEWR
jgi:prevent-host-death family protein